MADKDNPLLPNRRSENYDARPLPKPRAGFKHLPPLFIDGEPVEAQPETVRRKRNQDDKAPVVSELSPFSSDPDPHHYIPAFSEAPQSLEIPVLDAESLPVMRKVPRPADTDLLRKHKAEEVTAEPPEADIGPASLSPRELSAKGYGRAPAIAPQQILSVGDKKIPDGRGR